MMWSSLVPLSHDPAKQLFGDIMADRCESPREDVNALAGRNVGETFRVLAAKCGNGSGLRRFLATEGVQYMPQSLLDA